MPTINNVMSTLNEALPTIYGGGDDSCDNVAAKELYMTFQGAFNAVCQDNGIESDGTYPQFCGRRASNWKANEFETENEERRYTAKTYTYFFSYNKNEYAIQAWRGWGLYINLYKGFLDPRNNSYSFKEVASVTDPCSKWLLANGQSREDMNIIDYGIKLATGIDPRICMDRTAFKSCVDEI